MDNGATSLLDKLGAVKDTMAVTRAFGESYERDNVMIIPVASVRGGGGGGSGEGSDPSHNGQGSGVGLGFGATVRPLGVYSVKDGDVTWIPAIDVMRVVLGGQIVAIVGLLTLRSWLKHRR
jgi:uncharacterized spore protein YtfJ